MNFHPTRRRVYEVIVEMAGGSTRELVAILTRLRDERPELYRAFVAHASCIRARNDEPSREQPPRSRAA